MAKVNSISDIDAMEKKQIKAYIFDLEQNIKINKELLQNVLMANNMAEVGEKIAAETDNWMKAISKANSKANEAIATMKQLQKDRDDMKEHIKDKEK